MSVFPGMFSGYPAAFSQSLVAAQYTQVSSVSGTTSTLWNPTIPAGHGITAGSTMIIRTFWTLTSSANNKSPFIKFGGSSTSLFGSATIWNSVASATKDAVVFFRSPTSQLFFPITTASSYGGSANVAMPTGSEDCSGAFPVLIQATCATNTETVSLEWGQVFIINP